MEEEKARLMEVSDKIKANTETIAELSKTYSLHLFEAHYSDRSSETSEQPTVDTKSRSLSLLSVNKFNGLSDRTKSLIQNNLKLSEKTVDVPYIVGELENQNAVLAKEFKSNSLEGFLNSDMTLPKWYLTDDFQVGPCKAEPFREPKAANDFNPDTKGKVKQIDAQDLLIVRQELPGYRRLPQRRFFLDQKAGAGSG